MAQLQTSDTRSAGKRHPGRQAGGLLYESSHRHVDPYLHGIRNGILAGWTRRPKPVRSAQSATIQSPDAIPLVGNRGSRFLQVDTNAIVHG